MANMMGNLTKFLEVVDQKAGEIAAKSHLGGEESDEERSETSSNYSDHTPAPTKAADTMSAFATKHSAPLPSGHNGTAGSNGDLSELQRKYENTLADRDRQHTALQRDFDKAIQRLKETDGRVHDLAAERDNALDEAESLRTANHANERKLEDAQARLEHASERMSSLEGEVETLQRAHERASEELNDAMSARDALQSNVKAVQDELQEYRNKSKLLLQERDNQINALKAQAAPQPEIDPEAFRQLQLKLDAAEETMKRKGLEHEEVTGQQRQQLAKLTSEVQAASTAASDMRSKLDAMKNEREVAQSLYEGEATSHKHSREKLEASVHERDEHIRRLEKKLQEAKHAAKQAASANGEGGAGGGGGGEWERRAKELAEMVMEKQAALEAKRSETEQWRTKYEVVAQRVREMELLSGVSTVSSPSATGSRIVSVEEERETQEYLWGDFSRSQFFVSLSNRGVLGQKVANVARQVDNSAQSVGRQLRRNPVLRVSAAVYLIVVHAWMFFLVTFSATALPAGAEVVEPKV